eukprot:Seg3150.1 transcript_id=Seg3150.1/GoldUCD/mRNA.D3Y31 product="Microprocessor complex subunit DGCR8" pseudo=true protein_id=Seg3150.1/GoldUCD/D3Y31
MSGVEHEDATNVGSIAIGSGNPVELPCSSLLTHEAEIFARDAGDQSKANQEKVVKMCGKLPALQLPEDWIGVNHKSGGIVYLHKKTRVVTWSRPYYLDKDSLRKHDVPLAAIPCLHQILGKKQQDKHIRKRKETAKNSQRCSKRTKTCNVMPEVKLEEMSAGCKSNDSRAAENIDDSDSTAFVIPADNQLQSDPLEEAPAIAQGTTMLHETNRDVQSCDINEYNNGEWSSDSNDCADHNLEQSRNDYEKAPFQTITRENLEMVASKELEKYLSSLFEFEMLADEVAQRPVLGEGNKEVEKKELPEQLKAIPCIAKNCKQDKRKEFTLTAGRTSLSLLNEYCQNVLKKPVSLVDSEANGDQYVIDVEIDGVKYGRGEGRTKKIAKQHAASNTMVILMPKEFKEFSDFALSGKEMKAFDDLDITDPSVADCANVLGLPLPADVLASCLRRNRGLFNAKIHFKLTRGERDQPHTYEIICGKHSATGLCKNRRVGKQLASQAVLQKIHPKLEKWGQLIRLYCSTPTSLIKTPKIKGLGLENSRLPKEKDTLMRKLKEEMRKLEAQGTAESASTASATISARDLDLC